VAETEKQLLTFMQDEKSEVRNALIRELALTDEIESQLKAALAEFQQRIQSKQKPAAVAKA
jgi:F-type H+-transporting ATPase subunit alpha